MNPCISSKAYRVMTRIIMLFTMLNSVAVAAPKLEIETTTVNIGTVYKNPEGHPFATTASVTLSNSGDQTLNVTFPNGTSKSISPGGSYDYLVEVYEPQLGTHTIERILSTNDPANGSVSIFATYEGVIQPDMIIELLDGTPVLSGETVIDLGPTTADDRPYLLVDNPPNRTVTLRLRNPGSGIMPVKVNENRLPHNRPPHEEITGHSYVSGNDWYGADQNQPFDYRAIPPLDSIEMSFTLAPRSNGEVVAKVPLTTSGRNYYDGIATVTHSILLKTQATAYPKLHISTIYYYADDIYKVRHRLPAKFSTLHLSEDEVILIEVENRGYAEMSLDPDILGEHPNDFVVARSLPVIIQPLSRITIPIRFSPTDGGPRRGIVRFNSNDPDGPQDLPVSGDGFRLVLEEVDGADFGRVPVGGFASRTFALENKGDSPISGISVDLTSKLGGQLSLMGEVPFRLEPGERSEFVVRFSPEQMSSFSSYVKVTTLENLTKPLLLGITARGVDSPALVLASERGQISGPGEVKMEVPYDSVDIGDYKRFAFDLKNKGTLPLKLSADFLTGSSEDFSLLSPLPDVVEPGARIRFEITFRPKDAGGKAAVFRIRSNDPDQPAFEILLTGFGFPFSLEAPEGTIFDTTDVGDTELLDFVLVNNGEEPLNDISALIMSETPLKALAGDVPEFALATSIPRQLAPKQRFTFQVRFKPKAVGERSIVLRIQSNNNRKRSLEVLMKGRGKLPGAQDIVIRNMAGENLRRDDVFLKFGQIAVGTKVTRWFSIKNKTEKPLMISRISATGLYADIFRIRGATMKEIEPGGTMKFYASCKPLQAGDIRASFVIRSVYNGVQLPLIRFKARGKAVRAGTESKLMAVSHQETTGTALSGRHLNGMAEREAGIYRFVTWIDGVGYNAVRIQNPEQGIRKPVVEVSSDLVYWQSGDRHTVVIESSPVFLVVRDAQPCRGGNRFLRVRSISR